MTTMETEQEYTLSVTFLNDKQKPAPVDGVPVWATDNSDILTLTPAPDGMSCLVQSTTISGTAKVQLTADADLGAGVASIIGTDDVTVTQRPATTVVLTPGPVSDTP